MQWIHKRCLKSHTLCNMKLIDFTVSLTIRYSLKSVMHHLSMHLIMKLCNLHLIFNYDSDEIES